MNTVIIQQRIDHLRQSCPNFSPYIHNGYLYAARSWNVLTETEHIQLTSQLPKMDWIGEETGDDPLLPGTVSSLISDFRAHEIDMIDQDEYRYLEGSPVFTSALCPKSRLTRREIRIELAVRARGKWLDYAGQWWPESAFTWVGYLIALYDAGILNERDTRYLFRRLPKEYQQFFEQAIPPGTEEPALIFTGLRSQQSDASS